MALSGDKQSARVKNTAPYCYFFGVFETLGAAFDAGLAGAFSTAGFLPGFSAASAIGFGLVAALAAAFGFLGAASVSAALALAAVLGAVLAAALRATFESSLGVALVFDVLMLASPGGVTFDFALTGFFAGCLIMALALAASSGGVTGTTGAAAAVSCSSKARAFSQYSVERPSGRPSASHRWYACKRSFSSNDLLCIPLAISRIHAFMLQEHRLAR
jgi:hypothetical protein